MNLRDFYDDTFRPTWFETQHAAAQIGFTITVDQFCCWRERATVADLTDETLEQFRLWLVETGRASDHHTSRHGVRPSRDCVSQLRQIRQFHRMKGQRAPQDMTLSRFFADVAMKERDFAVTTAKSYRMAIGRLNRFYGSDVMLSELDRDLLSKWQPGKTDAEAVLCLWRLALKLGYCSHGPDPAQEGASADLINGGDSLMHLMANKYFPAKMDIRAESTRKQYRIAIKDFERFLGHTPTLADLSDDNVIGLMRWMESRGRAPKTCNERAGRIKSLWSWLAKRGYVRLFPTAGRLHETPQMPRAWSKAELSRLFDACRSEDMPVGPIHGGAYWSALVGVAWNTGERAGALLSLDWTHLEGNILSVPAEIRKGQNKAAVYALWPDTLEMLERITEPQRDLIFPFPYHNSSFYSRWNRILRRAKLQGTFHQIRRSHASWLKAGGGDATAALGHTSAFVTERSYIDPTIGLTAPELFKPWA